MAETTRTDEMRPVTVHGVFYAHAWMAPQYHTEPTKKEKKAEYAAQKAERAARQHSMMRNPIRRKTLTAFKEA